MDKKGLVGVIVLIILMLVVLFLMVFINTSPFTGFAVYEYTESTGLNIKNPNIIYEQTIRSDNQTFIEEQLNKPNPTRIGINILVYLFVIFMIVKIIKEIKK